MMKLHIHMLAFCGIISIGSAACASEQREGTDGTTNAGTTEGTGSNTGGAADAMDGEIRGEGNRNDTTGVEAPAE